MTATRLASDRFSHPIQALKPGLVTNVSVSTGGSQKMAAALSADTIVVRLISTVDAYLSVGELNTAAASAGSMRIVANVPEYFRIEQATSVVVAVMGVAAAGTLNVTEML